MAGLQSYMTPKPSFLITLVKPHDYMTGRGSIMSHSFGEINSPKEPPIKHKDMLQKSVV